MTTGRAGCLVQRGPCCSSGTESRWQPPVICLHGFGKDFRACGRRRRKRNRRSKEKEEEVEEEVEEEEEEKVPGDWSLFAWGHTRQESDSRSVLATTGLELRIPMHKTALWSSESMPQPCSWVSSTLSVAEGSWGMRGFACRLAFSVF